MPPHMNMNMPSPGMPTFADGPGTNLLEIVINISFGFVAGLMIFLGPKETISFGSKLAADLIKMSGYGAQMSAFGLATTAAPYVIIAPIGGMVLKQLASVRSLKSFGYFVAAVLAGLALAFITQVYFAALMK